MSARFARMCPMPPSLPSFPGSVSPKGRAFRIEESVIPRLFGTMIALRGCDKSGRMGPIEPEAIATERVTKDDPAASEVVLQHFEPIVGGFSLHMVLLTGNLSVADTYGSFETSLMQCECRTGVECPRYRPFIATKSRKLRFRS